jgi:surface antigen
MKELMRVEYWWNDSDWGREWQWERKYTIANFPTQICINYSGIKPKLSGTKADD